MRRRLVRTLAVLTGLTLLGLTFAATAQAQDYGAGGPNGALLSSDVIVQGGLFTVDCGTPPCADPGADVRVGILSTLVVLGHMTADAAGDYHGTFRIPSDTSVGSHTIVVDTTLNGAAIRYSRAVTITSNSGVGAATSLPKTGERIAELVLMGLVLIAIGFAMVLSARRFLRARKSSKTSEPARELADHH
jgi:LPXTG-motif cell wall-anchored protein